MIHVLLDTTVYRQDPQRRKAPFQVLRDLSTSGRLTLHIPYIVQHEFIGHLHDEYLSELSSLNNALAKLSKRDLPGPIALAISAFQQEASSYNEKLCCHVEQEFSSWATAMRAKIYPFKGSLGARVFRNYFSGLPPFGKRRERTHIPDAFILEEGIALSKQVGQLNIVTDDERLFNTCATEKKLMPYRKLEEFIKSEQCQVILRDDAVVQQLPQIQTTLPLSEQTLKDQLTDKLVDALVWKEEVENERIRSDDHRASISMVGEAHQILFDYAAMEYLGGGQLLLPFSCDVEVYLDYPIFKADYHLMSEEEADTISVGEYGNRHYFEAEEVRTVAVKGIISIGLDLNAVPQGERIIDQLDNLVEDATIEVDSIEEVVLASD